MEQRHPLEYRAVTAGAAGPEFKLLIERSADGLVVIDDSGVALFVNPAAEQMFGRPAAELIGSPIGVPIIAGETTEIGLLRPDGETIATEIRVVETLWQGRIARLASLRDVTTRRIAEERLRQVQKMEAIGQLTAGIAHDFNNLLTVATGALELLRGGPDDPARTGRMIDAALAALARAERLTTQLLAFSRKQRLEPAALDINRILTDMEDLLQRAAGPRVEVGFALTGGLPPVLADRTQLETALLNIAVNARDAMPAGGRFTIATGVRDIDETYVRAHPEAEPGRYLTIAASDTGIGMPPEIARHAFEPFFTTKEPGRGTGLGLAMVYGFVRQSGGHVHIDSRPAEGTRITLHLPFAPAPQPEPAASDAAPAALDRGSETVLVVEDNAAVRNLACDMLRDLGYTVIEAASGEAALRLLASRGDIDAVFSDVVMPGVTGLDLAREVLRHQPSLGVILTSGYASSYSDPDGILSRVEFVQKPYRQAELARRLRKVLGLHAERRDWRH